MTQAYARTPMDVHDDGGWFVEREEGGAWSAQGALLRLLNAGAHGPGAHAIPLQHVARGTALLHEGATARCVHVIQAGDFKCVKTAEDGYELVLDFAGRGDLLGFDALASGHHASGAVALEDAAVYAVPLAELETMRHASRAFDAALLATVSRQLERMGEAAWSMSAVGADVRVARFLVQLSGRMLERGQSPRLLRLRMGRRDIASHLGLAHESISRSFGSLIDSGLLRVDNRDVEILDLARLQRHARCTRGLADEAPAHACTAPRPLRAAPVGQRRPMAASVQA